jgi:hypothetical protein
VHQDDPVTALAQLVRQLHVIECQALHGTPSVICCIVAVVN